MVAAGATAVMHAVAQRALVVCNFDDNYIGLIVSTVRRFPLVISLFLTFSYYATGQPILSFLGWCITLTWACTAPFKSFIDVRRPDPYCPDIHTWAFPNDELVYGGIILVFVIGYTILWKKRFSWFQWAAMIVVGLGPVIFLVLYDNLWWGYMVISFLIGAAAGGLFLWWIYTHEELFVFMFVIWPLSIWYTDTVLIRNTIRAKQATIVRTLFERREQAKQAAEVPLAKRSESYYFFV